MDTARNPGTLLEMEILVCLAALPLLLIGPLVEAWTEHAEQRRARREGLRALRLLYGPRPRLRGR